MHLNSLWQISVKKLNIFMTTISQPVPLLKLLSNTSEFPLNYYNSSEKTCPHLIMKELIKADLELELLFSTDVYEIRCTVCIYLLDCTLNGIPVVAWLVYAAYLMLNLSICFLEKTQNPRGKVFVPDLHHLIDFWNLNSIIWRVKIQNTQLQWVSPRSFFHSEQMSKVIC